jgi:membrane-associated phospholipid phosphatase
MSGFYFYAFILVSAFYISYIGYFIFPAIGPRVFLNDFFTAQQHYSGLVFHVQQLLNHLENIQFDAFPSGHTLITLLIIFMNFKEKSRYRYVLLIVGIFLIFATVYFQYHYVVDVLAGAMLAVILYYLFQPLKKYFHD